MGGDERCVCRRQKKTKSDAETILNQVQHKVQHDNRVWFSFFVIPNLFRDLGFKNLGFKAPPCGRGSLLSQNKKGHLIIFLKNLKIELIL